MKHLKSLGVAAVSAMAIMAFVGVASASATQFQAETYPATAKGVNTNTHTFNTNAGAVKCSEADFSGSLSAASESILMSGTYDDCEAFGFLNANINMNGCSYRFHTNNAVDVVCSGGNVIEITVSFSSCKVTVGSQNGLKSVTYTNEGSGTTRTVGVGINVSGIQYTQTSSCSGGAGTFSNGTYTGSAKVTGFNSKGKQQGIWVG